MTDVPHEIIEARAERAITGAPYAPFIPGLEDLVLVHLDRQAQGQASLVFYQAKNESQKESAGARFSEALLPARVKTLALEAGIDAPKVLKQQEKLLRRIHERAPADLVDPYPVTPGELAAMEPEERAQHEEAMKARGQAINEFMASLYTPEEREVLEQAELLSNLERDLRAQTHEHNARGRRMLWELAWACRKAADPQVHYFPGATQEDRIESMSALERENQGVLVTLMQVWMSFKSGGHPAFFSRSSSAQTGGTSS